MAAAATPATSSPSVHEKLAKSPGMIGMVVFGALLVVGLIYTVISLAHDLQAEKVRPSTRISCWAWRCWSRSASNS